MKVKKKNQKKDFNLSITDKIIKNLSSSHSTKKKFFLKNCFRFFERVIDYKEVD